MHGRRDYRDIGAIAIYLILSVLFFGRGLLGHFTTTHIGVSEDPPLMMWFLVWWPHAIGNRINPMLTSAIWAPPGVNLAWETALPLLSLIAAPITYSSGPIAALNVLCLVGPAGFRLRRIYPVPLCHQAVLACVGGRIPIRVFAFHREPHDLRASDSYLDVRTATGLLLFATAVQWGHHVAQIRNPDDISASRAVSNLSRDFRHRDPILRARTVAGSWPNFG
jgi:hypothetical protein